MQAVLENGLEGMGRAFAVLLNEAMKIEHSKSVEALNLGKELRSVKAMPVGSSNPNVWIRDNIPDGVSVYQPPKHYPRRLRTMNMAENIKTSD